MAPKKGRRSKRGDDDSDGELKTEASISTEATEASNPAKKTSKKKQAKKNKKLGDWSDDEAEPAAIEAPGSDAEEESVGAPQAKAKKGKKKAVSNFAALAMEDEDDPELQALEEEAEAAAHIQPSKAKKGKKSAPSFADLEHAEDSDKEEAVPEEEIKALVQRTKGKKSKGKSSGAAFAALSLEGDEVEGGEEPEEGDTTVNQVASGFAALNVDDEGEPLEAAASVTGATEKPSPESQRNGKKEFAEAKFTEEAGGEEEEQPVARKKGKKKKKAASDFLDQLAALETEIEAQPSTAVPDTSAIEDVATTSDAAEEDTAEPTTEGKKKKKKGKNFDPEASSAAAVTSGDREEAALAEEPREKKKKGKKKAVIDMDAMLAQATGDVTVSHESTQEAAQEAAEPEPPAAVVGEEAAAGKIEKKKKGGKAVGEEEDLDALLASFGVSTDAPESKKSKKKKKGTAVAVEEATGPETTGTETAQAEASTSEQVGAAVAGANGKETEGEEVEGDDDAEADGKELTAAQKKKQKKKAKEKAKKSGDNDEDGIAPAKKGGKKESAAVRKLREEMERQKAAQEAAEKAEEERIRLEEEAAVKAEEEAKRKEEDKKRKKEEKAKERAELKRKGLLLSGKEKVEAERLAAIREQLLKDNPDMQLPTGGEAQQKKKPMYQKKKGTSKMKQDELAAAEAREKEAAKKDRLEKEEAERQEKEKRAQEAEAARKKEEAKQSSEEEEEGGGSDSWDDKDVNEIKVPARKESIPELVKEEEEEDEEEEEKEEVEAVVEKTKPVTKAVANGKNRASEARTRPAKRSQPIKASMPGPLPPNQESGSSEKEEDGKESSEEESSEERSEEEDSSEEDSSSEYSDSDESTDSEDAREERVRAAREVRAKRLAAARQEGDADDLRSPICCILGHVDTGKTKLLDNIRRTSVQEGEAGGITQQIGATYVPGDAIRLRTEPVRKGREFGLKLPGLLIIDTPGHESFTNLRSRGSSLCDIAILVVDIMHGLEPQTIESINLLKQKKTPFIVALNKVDRLFEWNCQDNSGIQDSLDGQPPHVAAEFEKNLQRATLNLNEQGLNVALYWKNPDPRKYVNIVPTSAITGEGIPDMLQLVVQLTQKMMGERLMFISELQCTVLEVKVVEGLGTTIDVVLVNGVLKEGDQIVLCGLQGPIVTNIRSLLTPHPLKELRVRSPYLHHKEVKAAQGIKIAAQNLENAVAGTQMLVVQKGDTVEDLKAEVMGDMTDIFKSVDKSGEGVCVQASTLGSLEALLEFLRSDAVKIPVSGINIGPVHKRDVMRASTMLEKGRKKYAVILAFDVPVTREAQEQATSTGVRIFTADIIYHLFDQFSAYLKHAKEEEQQAAAADAVFPVILQIMENCIFNARDPIVLGCEVEEGIAKVGTPLCIPSKGGIMLGKIASMELNHKPVDVAKRGDNVALKIEAQNAEESSRLYGRHFDFKDKLMSKISRKSIDLLKKHFKDDLEKDDWRLVIKLKKIFSID